MRAILGTPSMLGMHTDTLEKSLYEQLFCVTPRVLLCKRPLVRTDAESFKLKWFKEVFLTQSGNSCCSGPTGSANALRTFMEFKCLLLHCLH